VLPLTQRLSSEVMERHGIYLLDDGQVLRVWVGRAVSGELCRDLFDVPSYDAIRGGKVLRLRAAARRPLVCSDAHAH